MATNTNEMFREMFSNWSSVRSHRNFSTGDIVVTLTLTQERFQQARDIRELVDELRPKRVRMFTGVRFHGRFVERKHV